MVLTDPLSYVVEVDQCDEISSCILERRIAWKIDCDSVGGACKRRSAGSQTRGWPQGCILVTDR